MTPLLKPTRKEKKEAKAADKKEKAKVVLEAPKSRAFALADYKEALYEKDGDERALKNAKEKAGDAKRAVKDARRHVPLEQHALEDTTRNMLIADDKEDAARLHLKESKKRVKVALLVLARSI